MAFDDLVTVEPSVLAEANAINVLSAITTAQAAVPGMRAAGEGTIIFTGGGVADALPPQLATLSLGKVALRAAATMLRQQLESENIRVGTITIAGGIEAGGPFDPDKIAQRYWEVYSSPSGEWSTEYRFEGK